MAGNALEPGRTTASRLLAILDVFVERDEEIHLIDLAARAGLPLATAHRLARELVGWGALDRTQSKAYRVGSRMWEIGCLAPPPDLRVAALPLLEDLHEATGAGAELVVGRGSGQRVLISIHALNASARNAPISAPVIGSSGAQLACVRALPSEPVQNACLDLAVRTTAAGIRRAIRRYGTLSPPASTAFQWAVEPR
jgi:DNA-binding IclR family transcriptional regulator